MVKEDSDEGEVYLSPEAVEVKNFHLLRVDNELFHEEDYVPQKVLNIKRVKLSKGAGENWQFVEDGEIVLEMKGSRLTKKEKEFLYTPEGMLFLMNCWKIGIRSVVKIKAEMVKNQKKRKSKKKK